MNNEQFEFLDFINIMSFLMGVQNTQETNKIIEILKQHNEKIDLILKMQEDILYGLARKKET